MFTDITLEVRTPSVCTSVGYMLKKFLFHFQGPKLYHSINQEIQNALSFAVFTSKLKSLLLL